MISYTSLLVTSIDQPNVDVRHSTPTYVIYVIISTFLFLKMESLFGCRHFFKKIRKNFKKSSCVLYKALLACLCFLKFFFCWFFLCLFYQLFSTWEIYL